MNNPNQTTVKPPKFEWDSEEDLETFAKVILAGREGSGKTRTAIELAKEFVSDESKIAVINTEGASGAKIYKRLYPHIKIKTLDISQFGPKFFVDTINISVNQGMEAVIIDSGSNEWDGTLAMVNSSTLQNDMAKWKVPDGLHKDFWYLVKAAPIHTFVTIRTKTKHASEKQSDGKTKIRKLPGSWMMRDGAQYECDLILEMTDGGLATIDKTHYDTLQIGQTFMRDTKTIADKIKEFLYPK